MEPPALEELAPHPRQGLSRVPGRRLPEQADQPGAGVLGVEVDGAAAQRLEADLGAGQPQPALDREVGARLDQLGEDLGQQPVLGEVLGADDDALGGARARGEPQAGGQGGQADGAHRSSPASASSSST